MSNTVNISNLGVQVNFPTWEKFNLENLTNDGVILFQYFVHHCRHNAEWTHSDSDLQEKLGIKRTRLTTLRKKFIDAGILQTRIIRNQYDNKITAYRLNFTELAKPEKLKLFYREKTPGVNGQVVDLQKYSELYRKIAEYQPKVEPVSGVKSKQADRVKTLEQQTAKYFASQLTNVFDQRRNKFNASRPAGSKHTTGTLKFSPRHISKLTNAIRHFNDEEYIENAFIAFVDALNNKAVGIQSTATVLLPPDLRDPLSYFLSYSNKVGSDEWDDETAGKSFAAIYAFGGYYTGNYSVTRG